MSDFLWVSAHIRRKPAKPEAYRKTHGELYEARVADLCVKEVAHALEAMKLEQPEMEAR